MVIWKTMNLNTFTGSCELIKQWAPFPLNQSFNLQDQHPSWRCE
jgi:hypothetical protein